MLTELARLLGLSRTDAEASMYSERAARHVLNRRDAIGLAAAMCAGVAFGDAVPDTLGDRIAILNAIKHELDRAHAEFYRHIMAVTYSPAVITDIDHKRGIITVSS